MTLIYKYKLIRRPDNRLVKTPSIPVLLAGEEKIEAVALLDSGADISAMPSSMAEILGIRCEGNKTFAHGIGGKVEAFETRLNVTLEKGHERHNLQIPFKVIHGDHDFPILLGRSGFFDNFIISFDQSKERISLKKVNA